MSGREQHVESHNMKFFGFGKVSEALKSKQDKINTLKPEVPTLLRNLSSLRTKMDNQRNEFEKIKHTFKTERKNTNPTKVEDRKVL